MDGKKGDKAMEQSGVYIVDIVGDEYQVRAAGHKLVFKGNETGFKALVREYNRCVFILDDIPKN